MTGSVIRPMVYEFIVGEKFSDVLNFAMGTNNAADKMKCGKINKG